MKPNVQCIITDRLFHNFSTTIPFCYSVRRYCADSFFVSKTHNIKHQTVLASGQHTEHYKAAAFVHKFAPPLFNIVLMYATTDVTLSV